MVYPSKTVSLFLVRKMKILVQLDKGTRGEKIPKQNQNKPKLQESLNQSPMDDPNPSKQLMKTSTLYPLK